MKKLLLLALAAATLSACGDQVKEAPAGKVELQEESKENKPEELTEVGQKSNDPEFGSLELKKIAQPEETLDIAPELKATIHSVKLFQSDKGEADPVWDMVGGNPKEGYFLQIVYSIENLSDQEIIGPHFDRLILDNGEQIDDHVLLNQTTELAPKAKASDQVMLVGVPTENFSGFSLEMTTAMTMDENAMDPMIQSQAINFQF
ncbi:hypothetical protein ACX3VT_01995 [Aerococcus sanguinicola]|uniref:hypothetical protein n=1 Tax=unclassified Aerococcus TaxID=2618060 RepID=UPI0008A4F312|nr:MULTISPECIES: hypothetical protein [unclassified Aerococcus]KAB0647781.1 hypothetical protein F6I01_01465 [Aerococcus sanguinicola]MDK6232976.1 hypothetical protein [Aerococcus sp. UMB10185]MDK6855270.1 hypothetical protein [Aerococcus sp. UMB7533]MDK8502126.1 hypothetical protein [Aerococcus sp. UMB1112A]OFN05245.1 hypothetical protein HMPREF2626_04085 [Aerococcus sp. HMSC062A02]